MKNKVYVIEGEKQKQVYKYSLIEFILGIFVYAIILLIANNTFKGFHIDSFYWAVLASLIISALNVFIKPILIYITLPLTISTLGIFYPVVNIIILKITGLLLGSHFDIEGFLVPFLVSIFISILRIIFDRSVIKPLMGRMK